MGKCKGPEAGASPVCSRSRQEIGEVQRRGRDEGVCVWGKADDCALQAHRGTQLPGRGGVQGRGGSAVVSSSTLLALDRKGARWVLATLSQILSVCLCLSFHGIQIPFDGHIQF